MSIDKIREGTNFVIDVGSAYLAHYWRCSIYVSLLIHHDLIEEGLERRVVILVEEAEFFRARQSRNLHELIVVLWVEDTEVEVHIGQSDGSLHCISEREVRRRIAQAVCHLIHQSKILLVVVETGETALSEVVIDLLS